MATVLDIIKSARRLLNADATGETPSADDASEALNFLNYIIDSWNNQGLALYNTVNVTATLTANKNPHTVGTGGDINIARPVKIEKAFTRVAGVNSPVDFQMDQVDNNRYQEFVVKSIGSTYPTHYYYDDAFPLASFYTFPVQTQAIELHLSVWMQLARFTSTSQTVSLPIGYENALRYALAVELGPMLGKPLNRGDAIYDRAASLLRDIKAINQNGKVSTIDSALLNGSRGFQIYRGW